MLVVAVPALKGPPVFGRHVKRMLPFALALIIHVFLLLGLLTTKAAPLITAASTTDISLVPGLGAWALAATAQQPPEPPAPASHTRPETTPHPNPAGPPPAPAALTPAPAPIVRSRTDLETLVTSLTKGGPSLTSEPTAISSPTTVTAATAAEKPGGDGCQIAAAVQAELQASSTVKTALATIPVGSRSVANAILLWDGRWIAPSAVGGKDAFEPVVSTIIGAVNQSSPTCRAQIIHGVRFIILPDSQNTTVLAFGSAEWRWGDLPATFSTTF